MEPVPKTDSEERVEVLDSLLLGAMFFGDPEQGALVLPWPISDWKDHYPYWREPCVFPRASIGDCYVMVVDSILTTEAPFPGDQLFDAPNLCPELRFHIYRKEGTQNYVVEDRLAGNQQVLSMSLLENEDFNVSGWFSEQRSRMLGLTGGPTHRCLIRDAIAIFTKKFLTDGISSSYPCTDSGLDPAERFWVQKAEGNSGEYLIVDMDLEVDTSVPNTWLEEPTFDLVGWYWQHLDQHEFFEQRYYESHREELLPMRPPSSNEWHTCRFSHELQGCPEASGTAETPMEWAPRNKEPEIRMSVDKNNGENHVEELLTGDTFWDDMPVLQPMSEGSDDKEFEEGPLDSEEETFGSTLEELLRSESPVKIDVSDRLYLPNASPSLGMVSQSTQRTMQENGDLLSRNNPGGSTASMTESRASKPTSTNLGCSGDSSP